MFIMSNSERYDLRSNNSKLVAYHDGIPAWLLKENSDILGAPISDILNSSFQEASLPQSWKCANIVPIPKQKTVQEVNKDLRPISLTPIISKVAEDYIVDEFVKPAVLRRVDPNQLIWSDPKIKPRVRPPEHDS
jgi:hypothetical protein